MKHSANYAIMRKEFITMCDNELRSLNATAKAILFNAPKYGAIFREDGLTPEIFGNVSELVELFRARIPQIFNSTGAICSFRFVANIPDNAEIIAELAKVYENTIIPATERTGERVRFMIPRTRWTTAQLYALAIKANREPRKVGELAQLRAKVAELEAKNAELEAANVAKKPAKK